ncbi:polynucleotide adenylyltransferase [Halomonas sp. Bachu 37]|uniref:polynucleotide adenylyltransferase n=1 Tax=Halomonas kashgarensis TaxID=3084920 RepID=UPI0032175CA8
MDRRLEGLQVYRVGGAVRDALLGWPVYDNDWVVVGTTPEDMRRRGFRAVGRDFPVFLHPDTHEEYALARTERKSGHGYGGFVMHASPDVTLEEDLARRDLTINAMAEDSDGKLHDPYQGRVDLETRVLRHVSPAFIEDPLRVLRTARFLARYAGLGFVIAEETQALMRRIVESDELNHLAAERIWTETEKALGEPHPEAYFRALHACGALVRVMPELFEVPVDEITGDEPGVQTSESEKDAFLKTFLARLQQVPETDIPLAHWRYARLVESLPEEKRQALAMRLRLPNNVARLARHTAASRELLEAFEMTSRLVPEQVMAWLDRLDAWRKPRQVEGQLAWMMCQAPALGKRLAHGWGAASRVEVKPLLEQGYKGKSLGEALADARRQAVAQALGPA